ncbi:hypothetical protein L7F22_067382 [Adiantum nelumboides]|nr:hypothetical protein [Adiantum nelumboides]MCO5613108.1 hypothetical protein [Adiantum nelumboides]
MADRGISDLLSTANSLLNSSQTHSSNASGYGAGHAQKPPASAEQGKPSKPSSSSHSPKPSYGEVLSSAQVVMNAAKTKLHKPSSSAATASASDDVNMGKLASAAGTLIGAVSHYGKLEEAGYGKYAQKAQEYLHSYEIKHGKPGAHATTPAPPQASPYPATAEPYGNSHGHSSYPSGTSASYSHQPSAPYPPSGSGTSASYGQPSAPYPPSGYSGAQQNYGGYGNQGYSKPYVSSDTEPPIGYPPAGYPTSGGSYYRPSK